MAESIVINNTTSSGGGGGLLSGLLNPRTLIITLVVGVASLVIAFYVFSYLWQNILGPIFNESLQEIVTFFTTGFIGWLNPFDSADGDDGGIAQSTDQKFKNDAATIKQSAGFGFGILGTLSRALGRRLGLGNGPRF